MDIILVGDFSGSVTGYQKFITDAFSSFIEKFDLSEESTKIGIVIFSSKARTIIPLTSDKTRIANELIVLKSNIPDGTTNMTEALIHATNEIMGSNSRQGFRKMIVMFSDGSPDDRTSALETASQIKFSNIGICGVLIMNSSLDAEYMKKISSEFCYVESSYENLITTFKELDVCL